MKAKTHTIIVADSHEIVREAVSARLEETCPVQVVAQTADVYTTARSCRQLKPDILLADMSVAAPGNAELLLRLRKTLPEMKLIVACSEMSIATTFVALSGGAVGVIAKGAKGSDYVSAVNAAINGYSYLPAELLDRFINSRRNLSKNGNLFGLSARELEILEASITGLSTKQVATNLNISVRTVETHRHSIYRKTDCRNIEDLSRLLQAF